MLKNYFLMHRNNNKCKIPRRDHDTSDLNWKTHKDNITSKANRTLGFIRRNFRISSPTITCKTMAYNSLLRPPLEYASPVWDPYTKLILTKLKWSSVEQPDLQQIVTTTPPA